MNERKNIFQLIYIKHFLVSNHDLWEKSPWHLKHNLAHKMRLLNDINHQELSNYEIMTFCSLNLGAWSLEKLKSLLFMGNVDIIECHKIWSDFLDLGGFSPILGLISLTLEWVWIRDAGLLTKAGVGESLVTPFNLEEPPSNGSLSFGRKGCRLPDELHPCDYYRFWGATELSFLGAHFSFNFLS